MSVAVIQFPGSNCESETLSALEKHQVSATLLDWNSTESLDEFNGFILPGGFSYQDRIRAGIIAAKLPIIQSLIQQSEKFNKPILGICNGAQILIESGILDDTQTLNTIIDFNYVSEQRIEFLSDWAFLTPFNQSKSIFLNHLSENAVLPIQVCHGEGRFIFESAPESGLNYCDITGNLSTTFPTTPNGSTDGVAAISNKNGNILAIMPHPERSLNPKRYPKSIQIAADNHHYELISWDSLFSVFKDSK